MTLEDAKKLLDEEYERAKGLEYVNYPLAFALYQVWKKADGEGKMGGYKYIAEYTDETTIETLKMHGALSVRSANILVRSRFKTIGDIKHLKPEEIMLLRNAGRYTIADIMGFLDNYTKKKTEIKEQKRTISVDDLLAYCKKCADTVQGLADKILENEGHGESEISALGGCAYFLQQARLYRFDIPNIIECFIKECENGT